MSNTIQLPASAAPDIIAALTLVVNTQRIELERLDQLDKQNDELLEEIDAKDKTIRDLKTKLNGNKMVLADHVASICNRKNTIKQLRAAKRQYREEIASLKAEVEGLTAERDHYRVALNAHNNTALPDHIVDVTDMLPSDPPWLLPLPTTPEGWLERIVKAPGEFVRDSACINHLSCLDGGYQICALLGDYDEEQRRVQVWGGTEALQSKCFAITPAIRAALDAIPVRTEAKETTQ